MRFVTIGISQTFWVLTNSNAGMNAALALIIGKLYTPVAAIGARWVRAASEDFGRRKGLSMASFSRFMGYYMGLSMGYYGILHGIYIYIHIHTHNYNEIL